MSWLFVYAALLGGGLLWNTLWGRPMRLRTWRRAVEACGFKVLAVPGSSTLRARLQDPSGPVEVQLEGVSGSRALAKIVLFVPWPLDSRGVKIHRRLRDSPRAQEMESGDEPFDAAFAVDGSSRLVLALLDKDVRRLLHPIADAKESFRLTIAGGRLESVVPDDRVRPVLRVLLGLRQNLAANQDVPQRLADNALRDPEAEVRLRNLALLAWEFHEDARTIETLRAACRDASPQVRLQAAKGLGAEGRGVLVELAEGLEDDASSAQAFQLAAAALPIERARAILGHALRRRRLETAGACVQRLGIHGDDADVDLLATVMERERGELAAAAAAALGETGNAAAEPPLIEALGREEPDLQAAAATALGRVGSAAAVLPLKEAARRSPHDPDLRRATRQAIAEIQARLPGATPGQLSLAGVEAGRLSLAQTEAGQLSLAQTEAGQLSLAQTEAGRLSLAADPAGQLSLPPETAGEPAPSGEPESS